MTETELVSILPADIFSLGVLLHEVRTARSL